jgi:hypothetical protein
LQESYNAAKKEIHKQDLPDLVIDKIMQYIASDTFETLLALRIEAVMARIDRGMSGVPLYPELPSSFDTVRVEKKMQTKLRTENKGKVFREQDKVEQDKIVRRTADGNKTQLITLDTIKPVNRSARRRANQKKAKTAAANLVPLKETLVVPDENSLNSKIPANTGGYINGVSQNPSVNNQSSSVGVVSHSMEQKGKKNQRNGRRPKNLNQNLKVMPGHPVVQKQNE